MQVTILGNAAGGSYQGRHYSGQYLEYGKWRFLIDCGEGTQMRLFDLNAKGYHGLDAIFLSHLHGDHCFGLVGLLNSFSMAGRKKKLEIFAPEGVAELLEVHQRVCDSYISFPLKINAIETDVHQKIWETNTLEIWSVPLKHRIAASGYIFKEKERQRNILAEKIQEYGLSIPQIKAAKAGEDIILENGIILSNKELTRAPKPPISYAYCSDTVPLDSVAEQVRGVTCLYHEATLTTEFEAAATVGMHSTSAQAATIAKKAGVGQLLLGHISIRFENFEAILEEAKAVFPNSFIAEEGKCFQLA